MTPLRLIVKTEDTQLLRDLKAINNDGISISRCTTDAIPDETITTAIDVIIDISKVVAAGLVLEFLKKYVTKKVPEKTTINGINIENNAAPLFIEINHYIQKQQIDENNGKGDKGKPEIIVSGGVKYLATKIT